MSNRQCAILSATGSTDPGAMGSGIAHCSLPIAHCSLLIDWDSLPRLLSRNHQAIEPRAVAVGREVEEREGAALLAFPRSRCLALPQGGGGRDAVQLIGRCRA